MASWVGSALGWIMLFGFESDLQRAEVMFTSLLLQATRQVVTQRPPEWSGESTAAFRRTWLVGFAGEVHRRLAAAERAAADEHESAGPSQGPSVALVLADRRTAVNTAFEKQFAGLRKAPPRRLSGSGFASGAEAGRRADLGGRRVGGGRRQLDR